MSDHNKIAGQQTAQLNRDDVIFDLGRVSMPIIGLMREGRLSWAEKEECAFLLAALRSDWEQSRRELEMLSGQAQQETTLRGKA